MKQETKITCLNINCPERKGGKCTAEKKVNDWFNDCDWRKEFEKEFNEKFGFGLWNGNYSSDVLEYSRKFTETLLIKILAKCETAKDARECRHIIKDYILKDNGKL